MTRKHLTFMAFALSLWMMTGCHSDSNFEEETSSETENILTTPVDFLEVTGDILGYVFDEKNEPVEGAEITIYSGSTETDEFGVFRFEDQNLDRQGTFVRVTKPGFKVGMNRIYPDGGISYSKIVLTQLTNDNTFSTSSDFDLIFGNTQLEVNVQLLEQNGNTYIGEVLDHSRYLSALDYNLVQSSGGFIGMGNDGRTRVLGLQGIFDFRLTDAGFNELQLKENSMLSIRMAALGGSSSPSEVVLWLFNETSGLWEEKGIAVKEGDVYTSEISALGLWAIGTPYDMAQIKGNVKLNGDTGANILCRIKANGATSFIGYTDNEGVLSAKIPSDLQLEIEFLEEYCDRSMFQDEFGPFDNLDRFDDILIIKSTEYISGKVKCEETFSSNVLVKLDAGDFTTFYMSSKEGDFIIDQDILDCTSGEKMVTAIVENSNNQMTVSENLTDWNLSEVITLDVCFSCDLSGTIVYEKNDKCITGAYDNFEVEASGGSGTYSYLWSNGQSTKSISNGLISGEYCVTITDDVEGCEYFICEEIKPYEAFNIDNLEIGNSGCSSDGGYIYLNESGGNGPYIYFWDGPNGSSPSGNNLDNLIPGEYTLNAEDANGCEINETFQIFNVNTPLDFTITDLCDESIISVDPINPGSFTVVWTGGEQNGNDVRAFAPGEYCVVVSDEYGCERQGCVTLSSVGLEKPELIKVECIEDKVLYDDNGGALQLEYTDVELGTSANGIPENNRIAVSVFESGYAFDLSLTHLITGCNDIIAVQLPEFDGLENVSVSNTTCTECEDGYISWTINQSANCIDCIVNNVLVLNADTKDDFSALNTEELLPKGSYYVVVTGEDGCFIAHEKVVVD